MTRVERARKGEIDDEIRVAARSEDVDPEVMRKGVAEGYITVVRNTLRDIQPLVIGEGMSVKVNANIGNSSASSGIENEIEKLDTAVSAGADAVMDLSTAGDLAEVRKTLISRSSKAFGCVPLYEIAKRASDTSRSVLEIESDEMFEVIEKQCEEGVDFLTLHCGVTRRSVEVYEESGRLGGAVSRGGTIMMEWIKRNNRENPLYEEYDRLLDILSKRDVAVSLGDGFRPGAIKDATDAPQIEELIILGQLVRRAREKGVTAFVEGPGHVPLDQVEANIQIQKRLCSNAPFYILGPLVTDISPGYDHISGAIGGAVAGMAGADFLCYLTPAEHLRLPSVEDVKEGVIASKIAAHAADLSRGNKKAADWDNRLSKARNDLDWEKVISLSVDPDKARRYRDSLPPEEDTSLCSMCGEFCAVKRAKGSDESGR